MQFIRKRGLLGRGAKVVFGLVKGVEMGIFLAEGEAGDELWRQV